MPGQRFLGLIVVLVATMLVFSSALRPSVVRNRARSSKLSSLGSDGLQRPENEDSDEYQEYLRQLLQLQATRGKSGFSAPSSGSADAYVAKLNRLKVEKKMMEDAGVVVESLDTSYKPEDFEQAKIEGQEPLISNSVLTGEAAIPKPGPRTSSNKMRELTAEEIEIRNNAEAKVAAALEAQRNMNPDQLAALEAQKQNKYDNRPQMPSLSRDPQSNALIEGILGKSKPGNTNKQVLLPQEPVKPAPPHEVFSPVAEHQPPAPQAAAPPAPPAPPAAVQAPVSSGRKLEINEMEVAAKALQGLVKHRGGGPFGAGRLEGAEAADLANNLRAAAEMLRNDAGVPAAPPAPPAPPAAPPAPVAEADLAGEMPIDPEQIQSREDALAALKAAKPRPSSMVEEIKKMNSDERRLPRIPGKGTPRALAPEPTVVAPAPPAPPAPVAAAPQPATIPVPPSANAAGGGRQEVPIGAGLNQYLADKNSVGKAELIGLRDGLIQVLALISGDISTRPDEPPAAAAGAGAAGMAPPQVNVADAVQQVTSAATDRIASMMGAGVGTGAGGADAEKEVKMALSLLLKHRGGPGFGHGRLTGKELGLLENKLRSVADILVEEASAGA